MTAALKEAITQLPLKKSSLLLVVLSNFYLVSSHFFLGKILEKGSRFSVSLSAWLQALVLGCSLLILGMLPTLFLV